MSGPPAGYEEVAPPSSSGPPEGYEEVEAPSFWHSEAPYSYKFAAEHPVLTDILKSFDIASLGPNLASGFTGAVKSAYELGKDVLTNPSVTTGPDSTYNKFIDAPAKAQMQQAQQLWQQGDVGHRVEAAGHALAGAVPMIGPWVATLGQQAGTGDVGGAIGQGIGGYLGAKAMGKAAETIPKVPGALTIPAAQRGGQGLAMMDKTYVNMPVTPPKSYGFLNELAHNWDTYKNAVVPDTVREFLKQVSEGDIRARHPEASDAVIKAAGGDQPRPALTFPEARKFREALNDVKYSGTLPEKFANQIGQAAKLLDEDIRDSAPHEAFLKDYTRFNKEYAKAAKIQRAADQVGPLVGGIAGAGLGAKAGGLFGMDVGTRLGTAGGRILGKPVIGSMVERVLKRDVPPPELTQPVPPATPPPRPPGSYAQTREQAFRDMLRAKRGEISTTELYQKIKKGPKLKRIPRRPDEE